MRGDVQGHADGTAVRSPLTVHRSLLAFLLSGATCAANAASIAVDVGHYRAAPGAISARGVPEFDYNLRLAREMAQVLRAHGHDVVLIGAEGDTRDLYSRAPQAAGRDLLISVHHDSVHAEYLSSWRYEGAQRHYSDMQAGYSLFVSHRNPHLEASVRCASAFGARLQAAGFVASRYHADAEVGESRVYADEDYGVHYYDNLVVLHSARVPALLFEAGVLVNRQEELRMGDPEVRARIAAATAEAVDRCAGAGARAKQVNQGGDHG